MPYCPVIFDNLGSLTNGAYTTTAKTFTHVIAPGPHVALTIYLGMLGSGSTAWSTYQPTITYGSSAQAVTFLGNVGNNGATNATGWVAIYGLMNPTNRGSQTVTVTGGADATDYWVSSLSFVNVATFPGSATGFAPFTSTSGSSSTASIGLTAQASMMVAILGAPNVTLSAYAGSPVASRQVGGFSGTSSIESGQVGYGPCPGGVTETVSATLSASALWCAATMILTPVWQPQCIDVSMFRPSFF
jgi:hypothetical protein